MTPDRWRNGLVEHLKQHDYNAFASCMMIRVNEYNMTGVYPLRLNVELYTLLARTEGVPHPLKYFER